MASDNIEKRLDKLQKALTPSGEDLIIVDWGGDTLNVNGVEMTRAEFSAKYPDAVIVGWDDDDDHVIRVGIDLSEV